MARTFAALRDYNYRTYFTGALLSNIGTWLMRVAQDWLVLELSDGSAVAVGITTALQFAPALVLSPYGGVLADRFDKRVVLRLTQTWMALCALALGLITLLGHAEVWHVYLLALIFGVGSALDMPARQSFVSELVSPALLANAVALNSVSFHLARLIGPAIAGVIIHRWGSGWAILLNAFSYLAFLIALGVLDASKLRLAERAPRMKGQIRAGVRYVRERADLLLVLGIAFNVGTWGMNFQMTNAVMVQQHYLRTAEDYGVAGSVMAIGSLLGALWAARRGRAPRVRFIVATSLAFGLLNFAIGLMPNYWAYLVLLPFSGLFAILTLTSSNANVQLHTDPAMRGRVMALYSMVLLGGTPLGSPVIGIFGELLGPQWTLLSSGVLTVIGILLTVFIVVRLKHLRVRAGMRPPRLDVRNLGVKPPDPRDRR
ncbi:MFS transporter [Enemella sp. A6]|uniref:MFS transporter n=1 Tax=Enemella sp. A6 TaxID=3440152 RepID=UPI003EB6F31A